MDFVTFLRLMAIGLGISGMVLGIIVLRRSYRSELREKLIARGEVISLEQNERAKKFIRELEENGKLEDYLKEKEKLKREIFGQDKGQ